MAFELVGVRFALIIVAAVMASVFGFIWYHPKVMGAKLSALSGSKLSSKKENKIKGIFGEFIMLLVMAFVLAQALSFAQADAVSDAIQVTFLMWLGFIATTTFGRVLWKGKSITLYVLGNVQTLISMFILAIVLVSL